MRKARVEGKVCIGPNFTRAEFAQIKINLEAQEGLRTLSGLLSVAGNEQRLRILYLLHAHKEMCVCDLAEVLQITDSAVSQHLRKMKDRNIVRNRRSGQTIYYSIVPTLFTTSLEALFGMEETRERHSFMNVEVE